MQKTTNFIKIPDPIKMVCLILGGGAGSRLYPLTRDRSKPAVPIAGKYRLIDIPISNCINSGVRRIFVLTQYNSASLNRHIKNTYHFDAFSSGFVDILAAEQTPSSDKWFQGTADAVKQSMHHLHNQDYDYVLILSGDQLYQMNFKEMAEFHILNEAEITIATIPVSERDAPSFGIMKVKDNDIDKFIEKPAPHLLADWRSEVSEVAARQGRHYLASMGIYIFNRATLERLFLDNPDDTDFGKGIIPAAIRADYRVSSYQYDGYWTDIGNIHSFFEANLDLTEEHPQFNLFGNKLIYTRTRMLPPAKLMGTMVTTSVISDGCIIYAKHIEKSLIGIRAKIGKGTTIRETIVMGNDYFQTPEGNAIFKQGEIAMGIGENCYIEKAIIDKNCRIGNGVVIKGGEHLANIETDTYCIVDGIIVLKKGAILPNNTVIGE